jgi:hypothetical protein
LGISSGSSDTPNICKIKAAGVMRVFGYMMTRKAYTTRITVKTQNKLPASLPEAYFVFFRAHKLKLGKIPVPVKKILLELAVELGKI